MSDSEAQVGTYDTLPPVQMLILEVLAARRRAGDRAFTFSSKVRPAVGKLARLGLVGWKEGVIPKSLLVWLTDHGRDEVLSPGYQSSLEREIAELRVQIAEAWDEGEASAWNRHDPSWSRKRNPYRTEVAE